MREDSSKIGDLLENEGHHLEFSSMHPFYYQERIMTYLGILKCIRNEYSNFLSLVCTSADNFRGIGDFLFCWMIFVFPVL